MSDTPNPDADAKAGVTLVKVSAYRTSDGKLHDTRNEAVRAQAAIDLKAWLESKDVSPGKSEDLTTDMACDDKLLIKLLNNVNKGL